MIVVKKLDTDVLSASRQRIKNLFQNGLPVYLSFSGGKDSLVLAHITTKLIEAGEIDVKQLRVQFIDEEAIFPCVEQIVKDWRARFMLMGARFDWFCLEVKHFNCLNQLENDETFICWDRYKQDCWVRDPPSFAVRSYPNFIKTTGRYLKHGPRHSSYQEFLDGVCDGPRMTGVRVYESIQRRDAIASQVKITDLSRRATFEPIYDWDDDDVWRYIHENNIVIPDAYMHLYQVGVPKNRLRISQFFSIDTAPALARMAEFYPGLMQRILKREPTAYLVSLYWDSEMFRRRTAKRRAMEKLNAPSDARQRVIDLLNEIEATAPPCPRPRQAKSCPCKRCLARDFMGMSLRPYITTRHYETIYAALIAGDPKRRTLRALNTQIRRAAVQQHAGAGHVGAAGPAG